MRDGRASELRSCRQKSFSLCELCVLERRARGLGQVGLFRLNDFVYDAVLHRFLGLRGENETDRQQNR